LQYYNVNFTGGNNIYKTNSAYYGNNLGSYPHSLVLSNGTSSFSTLAIQPGHTSLVIATIYDCESRIYAGQNQASARLTLVNTTAGQQALGTDAVSRDGVFAFENLQVAMQAKTLNSFTLSFFGLNSYDNEISFLARPLDI
jgi:hypothetical protein